MLEKIGTALGVVLGHALRVAAPAIVEVAENIFKKMTTSTAEQAKRNLELKKHLLDKLPLHIVACATLCGGLTACGTRTIYVPSGEPVQLAAPVKNAPVWVAGADGVAVKTRMTLPEGWWVIEDTRGE